MSQTQISHTAPEGTKVYVIRDGILKLGLNMMYNTTDTSKVVTPVYTVLIDHPDGLVLFDAGCNPQLGDDSFIQENYMVDPKGNIVKQIADLGFKPEDIDYLIVSHLHTDHCGYIQEFPNAEILVNQAEFIGTAVKYALNKHNNPPEVEVRSKRKINWRMVTAEEKQIELLGGVTVFSYGEGHTYGMLYCMVSLAKNGNLLLVSDGAYSAKQIGPPSNMSPLYQTFPDKWEEQASFLRELASKYHALIWFGHDLEQNNGMKKAPEYYD